MIANIIRQHQDLLKKEQAYSTFIENEYEIIIFKTIYFEDGDIFERIHRYILSSDEVLDFDSQITIPFEDGIKNIFNIIKDNSTHVETTLINLEEELEKLEYQLSSRKFSLNYMDTWFHSRDSLLIIEKSNNRLLRVCSLFLKQSNLIKNKDEKKLSNIIDTLGIFERNISTMTQRLEALHRYYTSIKDDKINHNIYILSIISAIFLPLNLIVGFFGMNTKNLFFENDANGTQIVTLLLGTSFLAIVFLPFIYNTIYKAIFKKFFGRLSFYERINPFKKDNN